MIKKPLHKVLLCLGLFSLCPVLSSAQAGPPPTVFVYGGGGRSGVTKAAQRPLGVSSTVPALLTQAHTVFVSNAGGDPGLFPHPFTGTQDRTYGYFCDKVDQDTRFKRVDSPAEADLVLEVSLVAPPGSVSGNKVSGTGDALPTFKVVAYDRPTHYILWVVAQTVDVAMRQQTHDKNLDAAVDWVWKQLLDAASGKPLKWAPPPPPVKDTDDSNKD